jgi:hypothetical protein
MRGPGRATEVRVGRPDRALTANVGLAAVGELCFSLGVIDAIDTTAGPRSGTVALAPGAAYPDRGDATGQGGLPGGPGRQRGDQANSPAGRSRCLGDPRRPRHMSIPWPMHPKAAHPARPNSLARAAISWSYMDSLLPHGEVTEIRVID